MTAVSNALALLGAVFLSQEGISHGLVTNLHLDMRKAQNIINSSYFRVGRETMEGITMVLQNIAGRD